MTSDETPTNDSVERFVQLLAKCERRLNNYILSLVPNWADAEEVLQETKLRLWQQYHNYDPSKDFGAWACTIAYYQVLSMRKSNGVKPVALSEAFLDRVAATLARRSDHAADRQRWTAACLQKLSGAKRALLLQYYAGRETIAEIAAKLGRKTDAVRQELLRIRQVLYRCVEESRRQEDQP